MARLCEHRPAPPRRRDPQSLAASGSRADHPGGDRAIARRVDQDEGAAGPDRVAGVDRERLLRLDLDPGDVVARQRRIAAGLASAHAARPRIRSSLRTRAGTTRVRGAARSAPRAAPAFVEPGEVGGEPARQARRCGGGRCEKRGVAHRALACSTTIFGRCRPHSLAVPRSHHQRPARGSSPGRTARVQGSQPIDG